jgi:hypothetical protein
VRKPSRNFGANRVTLSIGQQIEKKKETKEITTIKKITAEIFK